jgi:hypothetical protein
MFEYLFPIFCFGLVITGIVAKGLFMASELANSSPSSLNATGDETAEPRVPTRSASPSSYRAPLGGNGQSSPLSPSGRINGEVS